MSKTYHHLHVGYGSGFAGAPIVMEWLLLNSYVLFIGVVFLQDPTAIRNSMMLTFWGGFGIVLLSVCLMATKK